MLELAMGIWSYRRFFAPVILLFIIVGLQYSRMGLQRDLAAEKLANQTLIAGVEKQNEAIKNWQDTAKALKERGEAAMRQANADNIKYVTKSQRILVEVPTNSDECIATLELLRKYQ